MVATLEFESTLTDRYQTTVPETVRRALKLGKRDKIHYTIRPGGEVVLTRTASSDGDDPALARFLDFLARDMANHPERLRAMDSSLMQRLHSLVGEVEVDLDAPLPEENELTVSSRFRWPSTAGRFTHTRCLWNRLKR